ncbi:hypothetical protein SERLADRAFT_443564 [Serpula lacrymans var. lacrymans S7.9]|uniref:Uncharacterized protein n=1 Tax=Serpula lacrymans var. lacrymans (strain S7.9) TaxID=578457 RepID=F8PCT2_SERL9|nr:uncharacterized protein SERLADRAFT_443564 [Serpula lacrymans var. lacrymans S7.9]EGO19031.1 hypothetical protein SERLADRAFT_443564 [Serpula lacrymans var. lacrymans S7.9]
MNQASAGRMKIIFPELSSSLRDVSCMVTSVSIHHSMCLLSEPWIGEGILYPSQAAGRRSSSILPRGLSSASYDQVIKPPPISSLIPQRISLSTGNIIDDLKVQPTSRYNIYTTH